MLKKLKRLKKEEHGQVLVFFVGVFAILLGIMALVVDVGNVYWQKAELQNVADAAALAGAQDLPTANTAISTAVGFSGKNGLRATQNGVKKDGDTITVTVPYNGDSTKIKVVCTRTVQYTFARFLGFTQSDVSAHAVAEKKTSWEGEALPFINWHNSFLTMGTQVEVWDKVDSGYFQCIENFDIMNNVSPYDKIYFQLHIEDGLQIKNGKVANKKKEIEYYYNTHKSTLTPTPYIYIFSLSPKALATGKAILQDGSEKNIADLKNKADYVSLKSLVLVKCTFDDYQKMILKLTSVATYDLGNDDAGYPNLPDYPIDYVGPNGSGSKLVE